MPIRSIRLTDREDAGLSAAAVAAGMTLAEYMRVASCREAGIEPVPHARACFDSRSGRAARRAGIAKKRPRKRKHQAPRQDRAAGN